ncbi:MAG: zf-TFIIB domain-containing protein [Halioglobus sp.]
MVYDQATHSLKCPKCGHGMEEATHDGITIDRCTHCVGLWFDDKEANRLKQILGSEDLDSGDPNEGWKWDSRDEIDCPRCGKPMLKSADKKQKHIWWEVCDEHGVFMDAGEFTDYKAETLLDWFRGLIKGKRTKIAP